MSQGMLAVTVTTAAVVILVAYLWYYLSRNVLNPSGKGAAGKTRGVLRRFGRLRYCKVLSNVAVPGKAGGLTVENMLVGPFGILLTKTLGARGEYYGDRDGKQWVLVQKGVRQTMPNPLMELEEQAVALRLFLSKNNIYKVHVETAVHITSVAMKTDLYLPGDLACHGKQLGALLSKSRFEQDNGVDVEKIVRLLEQTPQHT